MIIPALLLLSLGVVVIYSSSPALAIAQLLYGLVGLGLYFLTSFFDYRSLRSIIFVAYLVVMLLLLITFGLGIETRGSIRWIPLGLFNLQPSEFAKPVIILALSYFWSENAPSWKNIILSLAIVAAPGILIFRQPDLGTSLTLLFIWSALLLSANIPLIKLISVAAFGAVLAPIGWVLLHDYQRHRLFSFLYPSADPLGNGYNVIQSTIAVGSGEFLGRGLGRGTQSHLQFLPEFRTDFIFATIAEELGMLGSLIILALYSIILTMMFKILFKLDDRLGELILIGVMSMFFFQIVVNIGMNIGVMPVTGITLPLLSYGGSSILTTFISLGLVASIARFQTRQKKHSKL